MLGLPNALPAYAYAGLTLTPVPFSQRSCAAARQGQATSASVSSSSSSPPKATSLSSLDRYGFSAVQTERIALLNPWVLSTEPAKTIEPKLDHLLAYGYSPSQLTRLICCGPQILSSGLASRIGPNLSLLERVLGSKPLVIKVSLRGPWLLKNNLEKTVMLVVSELKAFGLSNDIIVRLFVSYPLVLSKPVGVITETLHKLMALGMNPRSMVVACGLAAMLAMKKTTWERKMQLYKSFGWSEEDTLQAFSRQPTCMMLSDDKIKKMMGFFKDTLNWDSALMVRRVTLLSLSLEKRIIPRLAVMEVLAERRLWNGKPNLYTLLTISEKQFQKRFVENYREKVPCLDEAYQGRRGFSGFASAKLPSIS